MSREIALDTIYLKDTPRVAHTEYSLEYHTDYILKKISSSAIDIDTIRKFYDIWGIDFLWNTNDGLRGDWEKLGRATDMGHAEYAIDGVDKRAPQECPFKSPEDVWNFDAVTEYGLPDFDEQVSAYESSIQRLRNDFPNQLATGGYYKTIVSGAIQAFGWEMFLLALSDIAKMEKVLDSFFRFTLFHIEAWAKTTVEVVIQHDDIVWTSGPFMRPEIYRKIIIPRYAELWKPLHKAGKKVLFCSDGNFTEFAEDIADAGADGFIFEPVNDFGLMVEKFGGSKVLIGSFVDCRDLTLAKWEAVQSSLDRTLQLAKIHNGIMIAVGNHLPPNIPEEIMEKYIEYLKAHWER